MALERRFRINIGWLMIAVLSFLPLVPWYFLKPIADRFSTSAAALTSLGQITGLVGMVLFSLTLVLTTRMKFLERLFGGMDRVYKAHKISGSLAFIFILFHPLFLAMRYLSFSVESAAMFLLPGADLANNFGLAALVGMILLLSAILFVKLPYNIWKFFHKFFGVPFFFAGFHTFFVYSDITASPFLRAYMLGLISLGAMSFVYRSLLGGVLVRRFEYVVEEVSQLGEDVIEISMVPVKKTMNFLAGQFIFVGFRNGGVSSETHPFSISSAPSDEKLKISVKSLGDYTSQLKNLKKGAVARIEGPFGNFSFRKCHNKNQIWIAGGIGITPSLSMARDLEGGYNIDLYYCARDEKEAVFLGELLEISSANSDFRVINYCSSKQGHITADIVEKMSNGLDGKDVFLCGPPAMMRGLKKEFLKKISSRNIHHEEFQFADLN